MVRTAALRSRDQTCQDAVAQCWYLPLKVLSHRQLSSSTSALRNSTGWTRLQRRLVTLTLMDHSRSLRLLQVCVTCQQWPFTRWEQKYQTHIASVTVAIIVFNLVIIMMLFPVGIITTYGSLYTLSQINLKAPHLSRPCDWLIIMLILFYIYCYLAGEFIEYLVSLFSSWTREPYSHESWLYGCYDMYAYIPILLYVL